MSEHNEHNQPNPTTEELLVALLARVCVLQGAVDALVFTSVKDRKLADKEDEFRDFAEWFSTVRKYATAARVGYLTEQFPQLQKLLEDDVDIGDRTAREIFDDLQ